MGTKALRKIQIGAESTAGTAVAATTLWRGMGTIEDKREVRFTEEDVGILVGTDRSYTPKVEAELVMDPVEATFEQLPYILEASIATETPTQDGIGSGYIYNYNLNTPTAKNTIRTYTLEGGDDQQAQEVEYGYVSEWTLEGTAAEGIMMGANWIGRQATNTSFTGAISVPAVEDMVFGKTKLFIDNSGGTVGTTQVTETMLGFSLSVTSGWFPKYTADGQLYFTFLGMGNPEITLEVTFEFNGSAVSERTAWANETVRLIRLEIEGSALGTPGTAYSFKTVTLDFAGKWEQFSKIDDMDGNDIVTGTFRARYSSTDSLLFDATVVNELTVLP